MSHIGTSTKTSFGMMATAAIMVGCLSLMMEPVFGADQSANQAKSLSQVRQLSLDEMNGAQFVQLVDPLMEGRLSRIISHVQQYLSDSYKNELPSADRVTARHYINLLDKITSGQVSSLLQSGFPEDFSKWQSNSDRFRRASLDTMSGLSLGYSKRSLDPMSGVSFGAPSKRAPNFDEMDRGGFSGFAKRRYNFDEMDRSGFSGFSKRLSSNFDEMDRGGFSGFAKRRYGNNFDELDHSGFSGFAKRYSSNFDEMDRGGFSGFAKRGYANNFDEMDRSGFSGFYGGGRSNGKRSLASMMRDRDMAQRVTQLQLKQILATPDPPLTLVRPLEEKLEDSNMETNIQK